MEHALAIEFLNAKDAFENAMTAATWCARGGVPAANDAKPRFDGALAARLRDLKDASRAALTPGSAQTDWAPLSDALAFGRIQLAGEPPALTYVSADPAGAVLFPLAHAVAALLVGDRTRLRTCANAACADYFWDTTKNGSRRWCRLSCMEKVRAPRRRR